MKVNYFLISIFLIALRCRISGCVPMATGDVDDERDVNFLINKIQDKIANSDALKAADEPANEVNNEILENDENVIHYDDNGNSIEEQKEKAPPAANCHDKTKKVAEENVEIQHLESHQEKQHESSEIDQHVIRYDKDGNTFEEYKDSESNEEEEEEEPEEKPKKKKKKTTQAPDSDDNQEDEVNVNSILSDKFVNKQLGMRQMHSDDEDVMREDDDVPLITIPMADILREHNRLQGGFVSSTEEYSEETTKDIFSDPRLQELLREISEERKLDHVKGGPKGKPAAKRVLERHLGISDESL